MGFYSKQKKSIATIFCIGGDKKTGKTHLLKELSNLPEFNPMGVLDTENGTKFERKGFSEDSVIFPCESVAEALESLRELRKRKNDLGLKAIAIDSGTGLWKGLQLAFEEIEGKHSDKDLVRQTAKNVNSWTKIKSPYAHLMSLIMAVSLEFDIHIFITAHEGKIFDGNNAVGEKSKLESSTEYYADISLRIVKKGNRRTIIADYDRSKLLRSGMPLTTKIFQDIIALLKDAPPRDAKDVSIAKDKAVQERPKIEPGQGACSKCETIVNDSVLESTMKQVGEPVCWKCLKEISMAKASE